MKYYEFWNGDKFLGSFTTDDQTTLGYVIPAGTTEIRSLIPREKLGVDN